MLQHKIYEINSTDDIELGIKRESKLEFKVSFDEAKPAKALFVFIEGCGMNAEKKGYAEHLSEFLVKEFDVAVLNVTYHCKNNRAEMGAKYYLDEIDRLIISSTCQALNINLPQQFFPKKDLYEQEMQLLLAYLSVEVEKLKKAGLFQQEAFLKLRATLQPAKDEYQNFGVMQALDILNAICFVRKNYAEFRLEKAPKTLLFGTSHGGYLAFLCAKFAPWLVDAVVENSGYVDVCQSYLLGKELDYENMCEFLWDMKEENSIVVSLGTKTLWTLNEKSPYHFSKAHAQIRSLNQKHLQAQASHHKALFVSYHSINDKVAPPRQKQEFFDNLRSLGYEARLEMIKDEGEIDGKFIKNLTHGMDMSLKTLIQKELPPLLEMNFLHEKGEKKEIIYESEDLEYKFKEKDRGGGIELFIRSLK